MSKKTIEFSINSVKHGRRLYGAGLKHRMLTVPVDASLAQGDEVTVEMTLVPTRDVFPIPGRVVHCGGSATIVQMGDVPAKIYAVIGELPPSAPAPAPPTAEVPVADTPPTAAKPAPTPAAKAPAARPPAAKAPAAEPPAAPPVPAGSGDPAPDPGGAAPSGASTSAPLERSGPPGTSTRMFRLKGPKPPAAMRKPAEGAQTAAPAPKSAPAAPPPDPDQALPIPGKPNAAIRATPEVEGALADRGMPDVFMELLKGQATGVLVVDGYKERYWGFFIDGRPRRFHREPPTRAEALEFHFSKAGLLEPAVFERVREQADLLGLPLDEAILRRGLLDREQVDGVLRTCATQVTERLMLVNFGRYRFYDLDDVRSLVPGRAADVMNVLWERTRAKFAGRSEKKVKELLEKWHKHHVLITDHGRALVPELQMRHRERVIVERYLRGGWQVSELVGRIEIPRRELLEVIFTLEALGLITLSEREGDNWRLARAERFLIDREDYMDKNRFAFVEAHWTCLAEELERACGKVEEKLMDPVLDELEIEEVGAIRDAIRAKLAEARTVFADDEQRREYRFTLVEKAKARMAAELFHRQGEMALFKGEGEKARECFERVQEVDPGGGQSTLRLARARRVIEDLKRGILTQAAETDGDEDVMGVAPEDLDDM